MEFENNDSLNNNEQLPIEEVNQASEKGNSSCSTDHGAKQKCCPMRPSVAINVILFIAVGVLYFLHFYAPSNRSKENGSSATNGNTKIAYFNTDSVFQNYELVNSLREDLKKEKEKLEGTFNARQASFEQKVRNYQTNSKNNTITPIQAQNAESQLMKEREEIMKMNEEYTQQLVAKESEINKKILEDIIGYANKYNEKFGADYIFGYTHGGPMIVANPKMDLTKEITEGLNKAYKENKTK